MRKKIKLTLEFRKNENNWTAECGELKTTTFGDTLLDAINNMGNAMYIVIENEHKLGNCLDPIDVVVEKDGDGYYGHSLTVDGVFAQGETKEEAKKNAHNCVEAALKIMNKYI